MWPSSSRLPNPSSTWKTLRWRCSVRWLLLQLKCVISNRFFLSKCLMHFDVLLHQEIGGPNLSHKSSSDWSSCTRRWWCICCRCTRWEFPLLNEEFSTLSWKQPCASWRSCTGWDTWCIEIALAATLKQRSTEAMSTAIPPWLQVNERAAHVIQYDTFYIHELDELIDIRNDYVTWIQKQMYQSVSGRLMSAQPLPFYICARMCDHGSIPLCRQGHDGVVTLCRYPFVFDAQAKTTLLQTDAVIQMQVWFHYLLLSDHLKTTHTYFGI